VISELRVRDLATISEVVLQLGSGLNVLTGETGAGKSMLVDAMALLLGERADSSMVRPGAGRAIVEGAFELTDPALRRRLDATGLDALEDLMEKLRKHGKQLVLCGPHSQPLFALTRSGLIDRLAIMIFPVVLGEGKSIFNGKQMPEALKLVESRVSDKGVAFLAYEPGGEVPTGSFATKPPSKAELELREKIKEGAW